MHEQNVGSEKPYQNKQSLTKRLSSFFIPPSQPSQTDSENPVTNAGDIQMGDDRTTSSETAKDEPSWIDQTPADYTTPELSSEELEHMNGLFNRLFEQTEEFLQRKYQSGHQPIDQIAPLKKTYSSDFGDLELIVNLDSEKPQISNLTIKLSKLIDNPDFKRSNISPLPNRLKPAEKLKDTCRIIITKKGDRDFSSVIKRSISEDFPFNPYVSRNRQNMSWSRNFSSREIVILEEVINQANKELQENFEPINENSIRTFLYGLSQLLKITDTPGIRRMLVESGLNAEQIELFTKQLKALQGMANHYRQQNGSTPSGSPSK